jgi:SatD family (SatD)
MRSVQPFTPTIGDEVQALFDDVREAIDATLLLRLSLADVSDIRFGIGWGRLTTVEPRLAPFAQDGPAWWSARDAIEGVRRAERRPETQRGLRTVVRIADQAPPRHGRSSAAGGRSWGQLRLPGFERELGEPGHFEADNEAMLDAFLVCRDEIVSRMSPRDRRLLGSLLRGERQAAVAQREGITQSAVSQRNLRSGGYAVRLSADLLWSRER